MTPDNPANILEAADHFDLPKCPPSLLIQEARNKDGDINVFGFECSFPSGTQFKMGCRFGPGIVDVKLAQEFTTRIVEFLRRKGDEASVRNTAWPSVVAMMQKLIVDFNNRRRGDALSQVECGTRLQ